MEKHNKILRQVGRPTLYTHDVPYVHVEVLRLLPVVLLLEQQRVRVPAHVRVGQRQRRTVLFHEEPRRVKVLQGGNSIENFLA